MKRKIYIDQENEFESYLRKNVFILNNINELLFTYDREGRLLFANKIFWQTTGFSSNEYIGKEILSFFIEEDKVRISREIENRLVKGITSNCEAGFVFADGTVHTMRFKGAPIIEDNLIIGGMVVAEDITIQKQTENALWVVRQELEVMIKERTMELQATNEYLKKQIDKCIKVEKQLEEEKERLAVTLSSIGEGIISCDVNDNIQIVNEVAENMLQRKQTDLIGRNLSEIIPIEKNRAETITEKTNIYKSRNQTIKVKIDIADKGDETQLEIKRTPILGKDGKLFGQVLIIRDKTLDDKIEKERIKTDKLESLVLLAGGIAHDFNNFLTVILGNIALCRMLINKPVEIAEFLLEAEKASYCAQGLTGQLLTYSRGGLPTKETASIEELLIDTANFCLRGSNVKGLFDMQSDLWLVEIDKAQISQVINNLVINAKQAMPDGGKITIKAENFTCQEGISNCNLPTGKYVKLIFSDNGIGISSNKLQKIFDPYFTTKKTGSGLGLAICHSIIKKHGGLIEVESQVGKGTTFKIYLPISQNRVEEIADSEIFSMGKGKILLIDDEVSILETVQKILQTLGYTVMVAKDSEEAIKVYKQSVIDKELFDIVMVDLTISGGKGGKEILDEIYKINPLVKAVVMSGYANDEVIQDCKKYGFCASIVKPYGIREISNIISGVLKQ